MNKKLSLERPGRSRESVFLLKSLCFNPAAFEIELAQVKFNLKFSCLFGVVKKQLFTTILVFSLVSSFEQLLCPILNESTDCDINDAGTHLEEI